MESYTFLGFYLTVNCIHCVVIGIARPFQKISENITEMINKVFYLGFFLFLISHYNKGHWSNLKVIIFYCALVLNKVLYALFFIVVFTYATVKRNYKPKPHKIQDKVPWMTQKRLGTKKLWCKYLL
ncbi:unnamed protein product [Moneuplotes crassus]|uniref:Uncharacterized protein n=1 Tax=Euplotes crassus TaxID=5936 RepID=A0AAD1XKS4_EUPCR|nr:unnamed protein product [Moneuplotes crassus]